MYYYTSLKHVLLHIVKAPSTHLKLRKYFHRYKNYRVHTKLFSNRFCTSTLTRVDLKRPDHALEKRQARKNLHQQRHSTKRLFVQVESRLQFALRATRESERYSSACLYTRCANLAVQYITECMT